MPHLTSELDEETGHSPLKDFVQMANSLKCNKNITDDKTHRFLYASVTFFKYYD